MRRLALQVEVHVAGELFVGRTVGPGRPLRLGPDRGSEIPTTALPVGLSLLTPAREGYHLRLAAPLEGEIRAGHRRLRVSRGLLCDPRPEPLCLVAGDGGELWLAQGLALRFRVVQQRRAFRWRPQFEPRLTFALAVSLASAALLLGLVVRLAPDTRKPADREVRLRSRPALLRLSRLQAPTPGKTRRESRAPKPVRSLATRPASPGLRQPGRAGLLGLLDPSLGRRAQGRQTLNVLAALDRLAASAGRGAGAPPRRSADSPGSELLLATTAMARPERERPPRLPTLPARPAQATGTERAVSGPSREEIAEVVQGGGAALRLCYERELLTSTEAREGRLVLRWKVDGHGRARSIEVVRDTLRVPSLRVCVLRQVATWVFPPCPASCEVVFPFEFFARS